MMRAFIDTSSLFKKYVEEEGSHRFESLLEKVTEIILSPVTWIEMHSVIDRRLQEKTITGKDANLIESEMKQDFNYFGMIKWNNQLEDKSLEFIRKYHLKTLDSIQLASGHLARADIFITSDKKMFSIAKKAMKHAAFV